MGDFRKDNCRGLDSVEGRAKLDAGNSKKALQHPQRSSEVLRVTASEVSMAMSPQLSKTLS